jgi:hypothetical protein
MLLAARFLADVADVNGYRYVDSVQAYEGDPQTVHLQLVDASADPQGGHGPVGRRYCPPAGTTLEVTVESLETAKTYAKAASQPFSDPSIWRFTVAASDSVRGTVTLRLKLVEPSRTLRSVLPAAMKVRSTAAV